MRNKSRNPFRLEIWAPYSVDNKISRYFTFKLSKHYCQAKAEVPYKQNSTHVLFTSQLLHNTHMEQFAATPMFSNN
jgi:hypothetical protein